MEEWFVIIGMCVYLYLFVCICLFNIHFSLVNICNESLLSYKLHLWFGQKLSETCVLKSTKRMNAKRCLVTIARDIYVYECEKHSDSVSKVQSFYILEVVIKNKITTLMYPTLFVCELNVYTF